MRTHSHFAVSILFAATLATLAGCGQNTQASAPPASDPEVAVATMAPEKTTLTTVLPGRTSAFLVAEVRPQVGGIIQKRLFVEGSDVKAGQVLYQIDPATYQAAYDNARAALAKAEANAQPARLKSERYASLSKARAVSQQDNDDAQAANRQAQAEVLSAKAALESAHINLAYTRVTAPIAGRIGKSTVTPGALVTASQAAPLATIQQTDQIYVDVTQSSSEVMRLRRDMASGRLKKAGADAAKARLLFDDGTAYAKEGVLQFSDITVDPSTGVITLRAVFPNPGRELMPGLYVRAVLEEGTEDQAILVPQQAVSRDPKGTPMVMLVKPDNTVEARPIEVSRVVGDKWLVSGGLAAGERVIVEGLQKVRPGAKVKPVEASSVAAKPADPMPGGANPADAKTADAKSADAASQPGQAQAAPLPAAPAPAPSKTAALSADKAPAPAPDKTQSTAPAVKAGPADQPPAKAAASVQTSAFGKAAASAKTAAQGQTAPVKAESQDAPPQAVKRGGTVYSPPKGEPWPTSGQSPEPRTEHAADQQ